MTAEAGRPPLAGNRSTVSPLSRIYGFGSVYAKTLHDSRLSFLIMAGLLGGLMLVGGASFGEAYSTAESRKELANLVASLPAVMRGIYGVPNPLHIELLGGSIGWKIGPSLGLTASLWSIFALSGTLAGEARRGSLEFVAVAPFGQRRIAVEKLLAHLTVMGLVLVILAICGWAAGAIWGTLPGDEISWASSIGFALWVGLCGLASGSLAFALGPFLGRAGAAGIAGIFVVAGYFINGYQGAVPAFSGIAQMSWFGWTVNHLPLAGQFDWPSLIPVAVVAAILFVIGVEAFARRDLGVTANVGSVGLPAWTLGTGGPMSRSFGERLPQALAWGAGIGVFGLMMAAAAASFGEALAQLSPATLKLFESIFPEINLQGAGGFLQLAFVEFGFIIVGFAAAVLIGGWGSDETSGRLEMLLTSRMGRTQWARSSGLGVMAAIGLMTVLMAVGVGIGALITGGDVATPILGTLVLGLYAAALAGIGLAVGGLLRTSIAGEVVAGVVILTFLIDLVVPALKWPDWMHQLALTAHLGQPMIGRWDWPGMMACLVIALGGLMLGAWGMTRRDVNG